MSDDTKETIYNDIEYTEKAYQTSEVAKMLGLAVPTIRKYSQILESKGYEFIKGKGTGQHKARIFLENDIMALRYLADIREKNNLTVEASSDIVINRFGKGANRNSENVAARSSDIQYIDDIDKRYNDLKELIQQQNKLIQGLTDKLDQQQQYINEHIEERDKALIESISDIVAENKQIEAPANEETEKKGFFARLFNK